MQDLELLEKLEDLEYNVRNGESSVNLINKKINQHERVDNVRNFLVQISNEIESKEFLPDSDFKRSTLVALRKDFEIFYKQYKKEVLKLEKLRQILVFFHQEVINEINNIMFCE